MFISLTLVRWIVSSCQIVNRLPILEIWRSYATSRGMERKVNKNKYIRSADVVPTWFKKIYFDKQSNKKPQFARGVQSICFSAGHFNEEKEKHGTDKNLVVCFKPFNGQSEYSIEYWWICNNPPHILVKLDQDWPTF